MTSKNLYLVRHAESSQLAGGQKDIERELTRTGFVDASRMGKKLLDLGIKVDRFISSTANRAVTTSELIAEQLHFDLAQITFDESLYEASVRSLLALINNTEPEIDNLLIVGHNPVITYLAEYITGKPIGNFPTCAVVQIKLDTPWVELSNNGLIGFFEYPNKEEQQEIN